MCAAVSASGLASVRKHHQSGVVYSACEVFLCSAVVFRPGSVPRGPVFVASLGVQLGGVEVRVA